MTALAAHAQPAAGSGGTFKPEIGQSGKDVIWVPTPDELVNRMLRMAKVTPNDFVIDLGSGDGKIAIAAARDFKARSRGVEFNPEMVALSRRNAETAGVASMVEFVRGDIFETDFSQATVVTMYLLPSLNIRLRPRILEMKPGTRVTSHAFDMGDWQADETAQVDGRTGYLWIVPAKVAGNWRFEHAGPKGGEAIDVSIEQQYQKLEGKARRQSRMSPAIGTMSGDRITITIRDTAAGGDRTFAGRVIDGQRIDGRTRTQGGTDIPFTARRI